MADHGEDSEGGPPSFDPRTWVKPQGDAESSGPAAASSASAPPEPQPASFDPKTWLGPSGLPRSPAPADKAASEPPPPDRRNLVIGGAGLLIAAVGVGTWAVVRRREPVRPATGAAGAAAAATVAPSATPQDTSGAADAGSRVLLDADSLQHLNIQLTSVGGVSDAEAQAVTQALNEAIDGDRGKLHAVMQLNAAHGHADQVLWLTVRWGGGDGVRLDRIDNGFMATAISSALTPRLCATVAGLMNDQSFYSSAASVLHDDLLIAQFVAAMAYDFNFAHEVAPGSRFRGVYEEQRDADGNLIGGRRLKLASLTAAAINDQVEFQGVVRARHLPAKARTLYLYDADRDGRAAWYDDLGRSAVRGLMRTPVEAARVTSKFGPRVHPIFERVIVHEGVDFGCPVGTPVFAAADGVVAIAGPVRGFGNYLRITHGPHLFTAYGHLSAYSPTTQVGARVTQGQVVAFTGNTGNSTGPHLHFEIRIDGVAVDPLTYQAEQTRVLSGRQLQGFSEERRRIDAVSALCA
jgi:murein DD-endopeptidase MepM/ murein hydrolase activator NlpD